MNELIVMSEIYEPTEFAPITNTELKLINKNSCHINTWKGERLNQELVDFHTTE